MIALGLALAAVAAMPDWAPARWGSSDPRTLELVRSTPVNCLLIAEPQWSVEFNRAAAKAGIATLAVVRPSTERAELAPRLKTLEFTGVVFEDDFPEAALAPARKVFADSALAFIALGMRTSMRFGAGEAVLGTVQGVWPGVNQTKDEAKAAPSGAPWIDTNTGFLRFARVAAKGAAVWIAQPPPEKTVVPIARYLQAIGDAAIVGARWVVALDADFERRLLTAREEKAAADWRKLVEALRFFEEHRDWQRLPVAGQLAIVQDVDSGGLMSGGILDMIGVKHTPVRSVIGKELAEEPMRGAKMAVNVDPALIDESRREVLRGFTRRGGTLLTAPPGWKFPPARPGQIKLDKADVEKIDAMWKEVNAMTGRHNLGARLYNVSSMLSHLAGGAPGGPLALWMVNYSDYDVEGITAHVAGKFTKATLHAPGMPPVKVEVYETDEGTGVDLDRVRSMAALVVE